MLAPRSRTCTMSTRATGTTTCGTGVVASALIFATTETIDGPIRVLVRGGSELEVDFDKIDNGFRDVTLTGPAEFVFEGEIDI